MSRTVLARFGSLALMALLAGCATGPAPIVVYEDQQTSVWLQFDPEAGTGHDHPASLAPEQMARMLQGIRVTGRDVIGGFGLFGEKKGSPVFTPSQITMLAPYLSQAMKKASPQDMVTFYLITNGGGSRVTSGGLFHRKGHLYVILANAHTSPSSVQYENTYEPNLHDQPLLPIARYKFEVSFEPKDAWIPNSQAKRQDQYDAYYVDESKLLVIDLSRLMADPAIPSPPVPSPRGAPAARP
jgi:hypothetical protein